MTRMTRGVGNAGMKTPYEQGYADGEHGLVWQQIYDQVGEEIEAADYQRGFESGYDVFFKIGKPND